MLRIRYARWGVVGLALALLLVPFAALAQSPLPNVYQSVDGSLTFNYPEAWIVHESPNEGITIASSESAIEAAQNQQMPAGEFALLFAPPTQSTELLQFLPADPNADLEDLLGEIVDLIESGEVPSFSSPTVVSVGSYLAARTTTHLDNADYTLAIVQVNEKTFLLVIAVAAPNEMGDFNDEFAGILGSIRYTTPWLAAFPGHEEYVNSVAWSPDGTILASGSDDMTVRLWDVATGEEIRVLRGHEDYVNAVAFSPDGRTIASASYDGVVKLWSATSGQEIRQMEAKGADITDLAFSPNGKMLAASGLGILLWDVASGDLTATFESPDLAAPYGLAFNPDGTILAAGDDAGEIKLWNVANGTVIRALQGHTDYVRSVAFSPDGTRLASGSDDATVRVWDVTSGMQSLLLQGHTDYIRSVAWSPDGARLASGSDDTTVWIWDATTGAAQAVLRGHSDYVNSVAFSPDSQRLASASDDKLVLLWDATKTTDIPEFVPPVDENVIALPTEEPPLSGDAVFTEYGCDGCHVVDSDEIVVGPSLAHVGSEAAARDPNLNAADYLRQSIVDPSAYVVEGFEDGIMPPYDFFTDEQLQALIDYLLTLK
ncbi:MAG TPA: c-type cytochrome [Aggregatilinea sp.]|jgi:WD40 repeat protein|uniref:WD40 domain-containing protein n=1 Tax=Aggregatilinea sp. TaxID=2806333 RepID=UPI002BA4B82C|nr:c-type cytochrome [Aggregatilinea sp.]HML22978.1 c-type cytochrome [Aggregatilinea sp.]